MHRWKDNMGREREREILRNRDRERERDSQRERGREETKFMILETSLKENLISPCRN